MAWNQLERMLTCAICLDKYKNPKLLPCQHSFCADACMEGLVDYARRQIKCPECRAEHRIPYQGVGSLPSNVTLIRFLELHSRITGEEPGPVPTFMEKCSVCGEKVEGVQRCAHCERKVCPDCREAHVDLLRREVRRLDGQSKRSWSKLEELRSSLDKSLKRLETNHRSVRAEIEDCTKRLTEELEARRMRLLDELDAYADQERRTLQRLKEALKEELEVHKSNGDIVDEKVASKEVRWNDQEMNEMKEIYVRSAEFVRLFEPELGDFGFKMRFQLLPEFEALRKRICELGELKLAESSLSALASALQYCNATGPTAQELCSAAAKVAAASAQTSASAAPGAQCTGMQLDIPGGLASALVRSQSDHRLASQFAQLQQQQQRDYSQQQQHHLQQRGGQLTGAKLKASELAYSGALARSHDHETEALRSRYAPPPVRDKLLKPDLGYQPDASEGESHFHFRSAFMRRREKERQQAQHYSASMYSSAGRSATADDDDEDLASEASFGGGARSVRFSDNAAAAAEPAPRAPLFDCPGVERAPLSGIVKLDGSPHLEARLHEMGVRALVDARRAQEEASREQALLEEAREAARKREQMLREQQQKQLALKSQLGEPVEPAPIEPARDGAREGLDEVVAAADEAAGATKDKKGLARRRQQQAAESAAAEALLGSAARAQPRAPSPPANAAAEGADQTGATDQPVSAAPPTPRHATRPNGGGTASPPSQSEPASPSVAASGDARRSLYGQAVREKSRRQLSDAVEAAESYANSQLQQRRRRRDPSTESASSRSRRASRPGSRQHSQEGDTGTVQRRRRYQQRATSSVLTSGATLDDDATSETTTTNGADDVDGDRSAAANGQDDGQDEDDDEEEDDDDEDDDEDDDYAFSDAHEYQSRRRGSQTGSQPSTPSNGGAGGFEGPPPRRTLTSSQRAAATNATSAGTATRSRASILRGEPEEAEHENGVGRRRSSAEEEPSPSEPRIFHSRFLSRSRTSGALLGAASSGGSAGRPSSGSSSAGANNGGAGYLASGAALSRERFLQGAGSSAGATSTSYSRAGSSAAAAASSAAGSPFSFHSGPPTKHPLIQKYLYWPIRAASTSISSRLGSSSSGGGGASTLASADRPERPNETSALSARHHSDDSYQSPPPPPQRYSSTTADRYRSGVGGSDSTGAGAGSGSAAQKPAYFRSLSGGTKGSLGLSSRYSGRS